MEYRVVIPKELHAILQWEDEGLPAVCVVNQALANFEPKVVFGWHLSIILEFAHTGNNGMPTDDEKQVLDEYGGVLDANLKANGNALFLARITWNGTRQLLYRVYDPEVANEYLTGVIKDQSQAREFDFRMEHDEAWKFAKYYLSKFEGDPAPGEG
jgi:hypothetical protein